MIVAATGHRPKTLGWDYTLSGGPQARMREALKRELQTLGATRAISGMAQGVDQLFLLAAHDLGIPITAALPCYGQEKMWPHMGQVTYRDLLKLAEEVVYVHRGDYKPFVMQHRNRWMVGHADLILAVWNGKPGGGTAHCVRIATKANKPVVFLHPETCERWDPVC